MPSSRLAFVVFVPAIALVGCMPPGDAEEQIATASAASALQSSRNAGSANGMTKGLQTARGQGACVTPEAVAAACAAEPTVDVFPVGCAKKTADGDALHVEYDDCTGPFGDVHVMGGADATFSKGSRCDEVEATIHDSGDLTANGAKVTYAAIAGIAVEDDSADVKWAASWSARTSAGDATGSDDLTLQQDLSSFCVDATGTSEAELDGWQFHSTLSGFAVCPNACPSAGTLAVTATDDKWQGTITLTFDGSSKAHVVGTRGQKFDIDLVCGD